MAISFYSFQWPTHFSGGNELLWIVDTCILITSKVCVVLSSVGALMVSGVMAINAGSLSFLFVCPSSWDEMEAFSQCMYVYFHQY